MEKLYIKPSELTAQVTLDHTIGKIEFVGMSIPEDSYAFFTPILRWIDEYIDNTFEQTLIVFNIDYCNTSSSMFISEILRRLRRIFKEQKDIRIEWYYATDDEDMQELGDNFKRISQMPFDIIALK